MKKSRVFAYLPKSQHLNESARLNFRSKFSKLVTENEFLKIDFGIIS